jgi:hypothetical protein
MKSTPDEAKGGSECRHFWVYTTRYVAGTSDPIRRRKCQRCKQVQKQRHFNKGFRWVKDD